MNTVHSPAARHRVVRITVVTPFGGVDLAVSDDALVGDVVRSALDATGAVAPAVTPETPETPSGRTAVSPGADRGWALVHRVAGPLPPAVTLRAALAEVGLRDGDLLDLRPRGEEATAPPVDDVAEYTRTVVGVPGDAVGIAGGLVTALVGPVATVVTLLDAGDPTVPVVLSALLPLAWVALRRRDTRPAAEGALMAALVMLWWATGAVLLGTHHGLAATSIPAAACGALFLAAAVAQVLLRDDRWRPLVMGTGAATVVSLAHALLAPYGAAGTAVLGALVLGVLTLATPLALTASGLGGLDDRVAAGGAVSRGAVGGAVRAASADLAAVLVVVAVATVLVTGALARTGGAGAALGLVICIVVAARSRAMRRPVHAVPLLTGGLLGAAATLIGAAAAQETRAVPVLVLALAVLTVGATSAASREVTPVTTSRARRALDVVERLAVVAVPLLVAAVLDLYRLVWAWF